MKVFDEIINETNNVFMILLLSLLLWLLFFFMQTVFIFGRKSANNFHSRKCTVEEAFY